MYNFLKLTEYELLFESIDPDVLRVITLSYNSFYLFEEAAFYTFPKGIEKGIHPLKTPVTLLLNL